MPSRKGRYPLINDEELVVGALLGDLEAFDELVRRFRSAVIAIAEQAVGSRESAEDVAQESFLIAFKALPQLEDPTRFAAWLCAITRRRAWRFAARDRRMEPTEQPELDRLLIEHSNELGTNPGEMLERRAVRAEVRKALAQLPNEHRMVMRLRYYEEWPVARIADFLTLPVTTVKWRLHHGRQLMKRILARTQEETAHDGDRSQRERTPADSPGLKGDHPPRPGSQHDGKPGGRRAQLRAAVQRYRQLPRGRGGSAPRLVPALG